MSQTIVKRLGLLRHETVVCPVQGLIVREIIPTSLKEMVVEFSRRFDAAGSTSSSSSTPAAGSFAAGSAGEGILANAGEDPALVLPTVTDRRTGFVASTVTQTQRLYEKSRDFKRTLGVKWDITLRGEDWARAKRELILCPVRGFIAKPRETLFQRFLQRYEVYDEHSPLITKCFVAGLCAFTGEGLVGRRGMVLVPEWSGGREGPFVVRGKGLVQECSRMTHLPFTYYIFTPGPAVSVDVGCEPVVGDAGV